jgi:hypothetical protein
LLLILRNPWTRCKAVLEMPACGSILTIVWPPSTDKALLLSSFEASESSLDQRSADRFGQQGNSHKSKETARRKHNGVFSTGGREKTLGKAGWIPMLFDLSTILPAVTVKVR